MAYKCLIIDDESLARELIESHLQQLPDFDVVASCASAIEANQVIKQQAIDLLFLDIEMPVLKGNDFYKNLKVKPKVIFTTAYRDYAIDGFELDAVDYLLKPIVFARFFQAIEKFLATQPTPHAARSKAKPADHIFVRANRKQVKIVFDDVLYLQSLKDYVRIVCRDKTYLTKSTLAELISKLDDSFVRVHRSYVIGRRHVSAFTQHDVELGDIEIPIGDKYREQLGSLG